MPRETGRTSGAYIREMNFENKYVWRRKIRALARIKDKRESRAPRPGIGRIKNFIVELSPICIVVLATRTTQTPNRPQ